MTQKIERNRKRNGTFRDGDVTTGRLPKGQSIAGPAVSQRISGEPGNTGFPQHAETPGIGIREHAPIPGSKELRPPGSDAG